MKEIYQRCADAAERYDVDIVGGAYIYAFVRVADAMFLQGAV
jgi:glutamate dehydrogenase/leucine dehydrogenase